MKTCKKCGIEKELMEFVKHCRLPDGYQNICKLCEREYSKTRYRKDIEKSREQKRINNRNNLEYHRVYQKEYYQKDENKSRRVESIRKYHTNHPDRYRARNIVTHAIRDGKLIKGPCEKCGNLDVEAHHDDYSKPLEVRWLCWTHHQLEHGHNSALIPFEVS